MATSFDDYAARRESRWSEGQRVAHRAAEKAFSTERERHLAIGADLAARRAQLQLSQPRLAELSGVQQSEISRIETGAANPTLLTIERLSQVLGLRVALVAADADEPKHATA